MSINPYVNVVENNNSDKIDTEEKEKEQQPQQEDQQPQHDRVVSDNPDISNGRDEFENYKSMNMVKFFHANIKPFLTDPAKKFWLLTNINMNENQFKCIWANNPDDQEKLFVKLPESDQTIDDKDMPVKAEPITATCTNYKTDDLGQHFPTNVLKYNKDSYWLSDEKLEDGTARAIAIQYPEHTRIKYLGINFYKAKEIEQTFDIYYKSDKRDRNGEFILNPVVINGKNKPVDDLQIITFEQPIITNEIFIIFKSNIAGINYLVAIKNELSEVALNNLFGTE